MKTDTTGKTEGDLETTHKTQQSEVLPRMVTTKMMYQTVVVVSLAMSLLSVFAYDRFFATKIAVFDFPGFLVKLKQDVAAGKVNEAQAEQQIDAVKNLIDSVQKNVVVLSGDVVLGKNGRYQKLSIGPQ